MKKLISLLLIPIAIILATSCSTNIHEYQGEQPRFDLKDYFTGNITAWGMLQNYSDKVTRRFCVDIEGEWKANKGLLKETFYFDDGEVTHRNWQLMKMENGKYLGTASDVVGEAKGQEQGFAFHWNYVLKVPVDGSEYNIAMDDWMYRMDKNRVMNKTTMKKFGVRVGEVTLFFEKSLPVTQCKSM
ncbi:DUF3833 domain-containing protein [Shewanella sp. OPT22]|nr:DUF3833 domain-containing protein [Shewanella sp. OPT22]